MFFKLPEGWTVRAEKYIDGTGYICSHGGENILVFEPKAGLVDWGYAGDSWVNYNGQFTAVADFQKEFDLMCQKVVDKQAA